MKVMNMYVEKYPLRCRPTPEPQQCGIRATSVTHTAVHSNTGSPTHGARPGIEPPSSRFLVRFINHGAMTGTPPPCQFLKLLYSVSKTRYLPLLRYLEMLTSARRSRPSGMFCNAASSLSSLGPSLIKPLSFFFFFNQT